jgi:hypothetical protein
MILALVEARETDIELDDMQPEDQKENDSECDLDGFAEAYELEDLDYTCDCKESEKDSVFDWPHLGEKGHGDRHSAMKDILDEQDTYS